MTHPFTLSAKEGLKPVIDGWFRALGLGWGGKGGGSPEGTETAGWPHRQMALKDSVMWHRP